MRQPLQARQGERARSAGIVPHPGTGSYTDGQRLEASLMQNVRSIGVLAPAEAEAECANLCKLGKVRPQGLEVSFRTRWNRYDTYRVTTIGSWSNVRCAKRLFYRCRAQSWLDAECSLQATVGAPSSSPHRSAAKTNLFGLSFGQPRRSLSFLYQVRFVDVKLC